MNPAHAAPAFIRALRLEAQATREDGALTVVAPRLERFSNPGEIMHGGYYCLVGAASADLLVERAAGPDSGFRVLDYKVNLFRPLRMGGEAVTTARLLHRGRRSLVVVSELRDEEGRLVCLMTTTYGVRPDDESVAYFGRRREPVDGPALVSKGPSASRFFQTFGIDVAETRTGYARVVAPYLAEFSAAGELHPSVLVGVADSAAGPCSATVVDEGDTVSTIEYKVSIVRGIAEGNMTAHGHVLSVSGDVILVQVDVEDEAERLCARMLTTLTRVPKQA